jgi:type I restriction enzyme, S subunit
LRLDKATRYVPKEYFESLKSDRRPELGDVLFSVTGSIAIPAVVDTSEPFTFQRHIAILKPDKSRISSRFLFHSLATRSIGIQARAVATGTAQLTIPLSGLRQLDVSIPDLSEQAEAVRRIDEIFSLADSLQRRYDDATKRVDKLTPSVLAKAFRGELVPQDPNDEPAGEMLERIKRAREKIPVVAKKRVSIPVFTIRR